MRWLYGITDQWTWVMVLPKPMGVGDGQEGLACCSSWDNKEVDMNERLN